jgi:hypothetical protein
MVATVLFVLAALAGVARPASACDICAVYTAAELRTNESGLRLGLAEQFTHFATEQQDGEEVPNEAGERLNSSITQVVLGYGFTPRLGVQLSLPLVARVFRRLEDGRLVHGNETGVGDLTLLGRVLAHSLITERAVFRFSLLGGIKFPTGDPDRLAEELGETGSGAAPQGAASVHPARVALHGGGEDDGGAGGETAPASGIHGHDLALGSGSYDGIVGAQLLWSWRRLFVTAAGQYAIRTEGAFAYRYANDLVWSGGPGVLAFLDHRGSLSLQAVLSGETKGNDTQAGVQLDDTAITALYLGPGLSLTYGTSLVADIAADLPIVLNNTGLQIVPDFRLRAGVTWLF